MSFSPRRSVLMTSKPGWQWLNKLKLNDNKYTLIESLSLSPPSPPPPPPQMTVGSASLGLPMSDLTVNNLGVTPDCHLTVKIHISSLVHSADFNSVALVPSTIFCHYRCHKHTRLCFVLSRLDYCSSLSPVGLAVLSISSANYKKFIDNAAHLVVSGSKKTDHISPHLASVSNGCPHWFTNTIQTHFSVFTASTDSTAPGYFTDWTL